jgi:ABC-type transporter lipoprotein component MlaA
MTQKDKQTSSTIRNIINKNSSDDNEETNNSNDSFDLFRHIYAKKLKKKNKKKNTSEIIEKKIKSIDFDQIISREDLEEVKNRHSSVVPYLFPNFS